MIFRQIGRSAPCRPCPPLLRSSALHDDTRPAITSDDDARSIVDDLIEERARQLRERPILWRIVRGFMYPILQYRQAVKLARKIKYADGHKVMAYASRVLSMQLKITGLENIPTSGRAILISNHPTGLADGIVVRDMLIKRRRDFMIYANSDAFRVVKGFGDILIPVDLGQHIGKMSRSSRRAFVMTDQAFREEKLVVVFPSGRLSYLTWRGLTERPWQSSFLKFVRKYQTPVIPVTMRARNSVLFYIFSMINTELRDISLFYELLNKKGTSFEVKVGKPMMPDDFPEGDLDEQAVKLKRFIERGQTGQPFD